MQKILLIAVIAMALIGFAFMTIGFIIQTNNVYGLKMYLAMCELE